MQLINKINTVLKDGLEPIEEGVKNFNAPSPSWEEIAKSRLSICKGCKHFKKEPIPFLRVKDERLPEASNMSCHDCGCLLPYKLRQNESICAKWEHLPNNIIND